jgi:hypothetical protein
MQLILPTYLTTELIHLAIETLTITVATKDCLVLI